MPLNIYALFYAKSLDMSTPEYGKCMFLSLLFSLVLAYPIGILADRFHPLRVGMALQCVYILVALADGMLVRDARTFAVGIVAQSVVYGSWMTAVASIAQKLLPKANFTQIASAGSIIGSVTNISVPPLIGLFLDYHHHNYRYTFFISSFIATAAVLATAVLHHKFVQLGGPRNYIAPE